MPPFAKRLTKRLWYAANAVWAVPVVVLIRLLRPIVHIRATILLSHRIGHFVADASILLAQQSVETSTKSTYDLFWIPPQVSNRQWARMVRRRLFVRPWVRYLAVFNELLPGGRAHSVPLPSWADDRTAYEPLRRTSERFAFTSDEDEAARRWLRQHGWKEGDAFVCLQVRDSAYLGREAIRTSTSPDNYDYHNYRDSDIRDYTEAVTRLLDKGYWVVRMGKAVHERLPVTHAKFIDYPFDNTKDDLLDIWLSVHCCLFVSTATGIDMIPWVYGAPPLVYVNALPLFACASSVENIWVPKHLRWQQDRRFLTLREHCEHAYGRTEDYARAGILVQELSPAEITAAVLEGESRIAGEWTESEDDRRRQQRAWAVIRSMPDADKYHSYVHPKARLGASWLRSMGDSFLE